MWHRKQQHQQMGLGQIVLLLHVLCVVHLAVLHQQQQQQELQEGLYGHLLFRLLRSGSWINNNKNWWYPMISFAVFLRQFNLFRTKQDKRRPSRHLSVLHRLKVDAPSTMTLLLVVVL